MSNFLIMCQQKNRQKFQKKYHKILKVLHMKFIMRKRLLFVEFKINLKYNLDIKRDIGL